MVLKNGRHVLTQAYSNDRSGNLRVKGIWQQNFFSCHMKQLKLLTTYFTHSFYLIWFRRYFISKFAHVRHLGYAYPHWICMTSQAGENCFRYSTFLVFFTMLNLVSQFIIIYVQVMYNAYH